MAALPACLALVGCEQAPVVVARISETETPTAGTGAAGAAAGSGAEPVGTAGTGAGIAGMAGTAGQGGPACQLHRLYGDVSFTALNDCRVPESRRAQVEDILEELMDEPVPPPMGESRPPEPCDFWSVPLYEDPNMPGQFLVCEYLCRIMELWAVREWNRYQACLAGEMPAGD